MRFLAKKNSSCIWVAILLVELFYIDMPVVRTDGRSGVRSRDYQFSRMGRLPNFLTHGAPLRARRAPVQVQPLLKNL